MILLVARCLSHYTPDPKEEYLDCSILLFLQLGKPRACVETSVLALVSCDIDIYQLGINQVSIRYRSKIIFLEYFIPKIVQIPDLISVRY